MQKGPSTEVFHAYELFLAALHWKTPEQVCVTISQLWIGLPGGTRDEGEYEGDEGGEQQEASQGVAKTQQGFFPVPRPVHLTVPLN